MKCSDSGGDRTIRTGHTATLVAARAWLLVAIPLAALGCRCDPTLPRRRAPSRAAPRAPSPFARASGYDPDWRRPPVPASAAGGMATTATPSPVAPVAAGDPLHGHFSLAQATAGLPPGTALIAHIGTSHGPLQCRLWPRRAPRTVAHFTGLANGNRPWRSADGWRRGPAYDGSLFHRIDPAGGLRGGRGGTVPKGAPGVFIAAERWPGMKHDRAGLLCAVGADAGRFGMEFLITTRALPQLDAATAGRAAFTVFGHCTPLSRIRSMAALAATKGRPDTPLVIDTIRVRRR